jgi:cellulose biosynthesis protein BcsQ
MPAKIFCLASPKGGSGKTIITATLGAFLAGIGKKVLIIDADAATNGLTLFYLEEVTNQNKLATSENRIPAGVYEVDIQINFTPNLRISSPEIVKLSNGVHLIPAIYKFKDTELVPKTDFGKSLKNAIESTKNLYEYIFIDAQAGSDEHAKICMEKKISDEVIIVSEYDPISNIGINRLRGVLKEDLNPNRIWILYNKLLPDIAKAYGDFLKVERFLPPIPWDTDVVKAYVNLKLALDLENGNEYTLAIIRIVKSLLGDSISSDLDKWMKQHVAIIRQPINKQYEDLELQLKENIRLQEQLRIKSEKHVVFRLSQFVLVIFAAIMAILFSFLIFFPQTIFYITDPIYFLITILIFETFILSFTFPFLRDVAKKTKESPEYQFNKSRLIRQQSVLEERLKKLEVLKTADLETLIRHKKIE